MPLLEFPDGTNLPKLGPCVYQGSAYLIPGDIDDCAVVATGTAARAVGAKMVTIPVFRKAAGVPDRPNNPDGMNKAEVLQGARAVYGTQCRVLSGPIDWDPFIARVRAGAVFSVAVLSSALPSRLQYGFKGIHQVSGRISAGQLYIHNPLNHEGADAEPITEAGLKRAVMALGKVSAVLFYPLAEVTAPPNIPVPPPPPPAVDCHSQAELNAAYAGGRADGLKAAKAALEGLS